MCDHKQVKELVSAEFFFACDSFYFFVQISRILSLDKCELLIFPSIPVFVLFAHSSHAVHATQFRQIRRCFLLQICASFFALFAQMHFLPLSLAAQRFHLRTIIIKNNLHLLLFFIVCSLHLFSTSNGIFSVYFTC